MRHSFTHSYQPLNRVHLIRANRTTHGHFGPTKAGPQAATNTITDNTDKSPQIIALSGTGLVPSESLSEMDPSFGSTAMGTSSASQAATLTNSGSAALSISDISLTGTDASSFVFANNCGASLAAGANRTIHGHFAPAATGTLTAAITITDSASGSPQSIALSGTGQRP